MASVASESDRWFLNFEASLEKNRVDISRLQDRIQRLRLRCAKTVLSLNSSSPQPPRTSEDK